MELMLTLFIGYCLAAYAIWWFVLPLIVWLSSNKNIYFGVIVIWVIGIPFAPIFLPYAIYQHLKGKF
jgi:hypothetical protein